MAVTLELRKPNTCSPATTSCNCLLVVVWWVWPCIQSKNSRHSWQSTRLSHLLFKQVPQIAGHVPLEITSDGLWLMTWLPLFAWCMLWNRHTSMKEGTCKWNQTVYHSLVKHETPHRVPKTLNMLLTEDQVYCCDHLPRLHTSEVQRSLSFWNVNLSHLSRATNVERHKICL